MKWHYVGRTMGKMITIRSKARASSLAAAAAVASKAAVAAQ